MRPATLGLHLYFTWVVIAKYGLTLGVPFLFLPFIGETILGVRDAEWSHIFAVYSPCLLLFLTGWFTVVTLRLKVDEIVSSQRDISN